MDAASIDLELAAEDVAAAVKDLEGPPSEPSPLPLGTPVGEKKSDGGRMHRYAIEEHDLIDGATERDDEWYAGCSRSLYLRCFAPSV